MKLIEAEKAKDVIHEYFKLLMAKDASGTDVYKLAVGIVSCLEHDANLLNAIDELPSAEPERKTGHWILDRSGAYCCNKCMEPCAGYVMMRPRDKFCKMCGSRNEVTE